MYKRRNIEHITFMPSANARPFDSFSQMGFELNAKGFIRNDFSQLMERENQLGFMRALQAMQEYSEDNSNDGKTFEEIVRSVRPRWCQLNGELDRFEQYCIDNAIDFYQRLKDSNTPQGDVAKQVAEGIGVIPTTEPAVVGTPKS